MKNPAFIEISFLNWKQHLNKGIILLDFWAEWCSACRAQDKIYEAIVEELNGSLRIGKINIADNRFLAEQFGVRNIPHLTLLNNGEQLMQMTGVQSKTQLLNQIKNHIK